MKKKGKLYDLKDKIKNFKNEHDKNNIKEIANLIVGIKTVGYFLKQIPSAILKKRNAKRNGKKNAELMDYIEEPDFDWDDETIRISVNTEKKLNKIKEVVAKFKLRNIIKSAYKKVRDLIKGRNTKNLNNGDENNKTENLDSDVKKLEQNNKRKELLNLLNVKLENFKFAEETKKVNSIENLQR